MTPDPERRIDRGQELAELLAAVGTTADAPADQQGRADAAHLAEVTRAWAELSAAYRAGRATPGGPRFGPAHAVAYAVARAPATAAAVAAVLDEAIDRLPDWGPTSVLDVGAGLGTASWTAMATFPTLEAGHLVERSDAMIEGGRALSAAAASTAIRDRTWQRGDVTAVGPTPYDLVVAAYVLSELDPEVAERAVTSWWAAAGQVLVIVDTGTPAGSARVLAARDQLLAAGARVLAPCPSDDPCPKVGPDWCHFSVRLPRSEAHRRVKGASRSFEDEPYSYLVASRLAGTPAPGRVLRHPQVRSGHVRLAICHAGEETEVVIGKAGRDRYRWARKAVWGDAVPPDLVVPARPAEFLTGSVGNQPDPD